MIVYDGMRTFSCQIILPLRAGSTIFQGKPLKRLALENGIWHIPIESLKSWLCHSQPHGPVGHVGGTFVSCALEREHPPATRVIRMREKSEPMKRTWPGPGT